jgi:hypothetical protein
MRKQKPVKQPPTPQRENWQPDRTAARHKLWNDLGVVTTNAQDMGLSRVAVIEDLIRVADNLCALCGENGDDMGSLERLL